MVPKLSPKKDPFLATELSGTLSQLVYWVMLSFLADIFTDKTHRGTSIRNRIVLFRLFAEAKPPFHQAVEYPVYPTDGI